MLVVIVCLIVVLYVVWIGLSRLFSFLVLQGFVLVPGVLCQCCCSCVCVFKPGAVCGFCKFAKLV
jgi:hypothetical protein